MKINRKIVTFSTVLITQLLSYTLGSTHDDFWNFKQKVDEGSTFELNVSALSEALQQVPHVSERKPSDIILVMPSADGKKHSFTFYQNTVIHPNLEKKYPNIKTYVGVGVENPTHRATIVLNGDRIIGSVESNIDPSFFKSFNAEDRRDGILVFNETIRNQDVICKTNSSVLEQDREFPECMGTDDPCYPAGVELVTYRFAAFLTEAVTNDAADGTVEGGLTWLVGSVAYVNALYVRDVAFQLQIVENNDELIFTDSNPAPDVFNQDCGGGWGDLGCELGVVDSVLDARIGSGGWDSVDEERVWDYGALFDHGYPGGLAYCPGPTSAQVPAMYVFSHEVMHNFGSPHNYCGENGIRTALGGTIMVHRVNETNNVFSTHSTEWALNYQESVGPYGNWYYHNGFTTEELNNIIPEVLLPESGFTIPAETPYVLEGSSDPISENYTYNWESNDTADEQYSADPDATDLPFLLPDQGSLSITVTPHLEGNKRFFPDMDILLNNEYEKYGVNAYTGINQIVEKLPFATREMNMRLVVRTNDPYAGALNHKNLKFFVDGTAGPFRVTSQPDSTVWSVGSEETITWDVANTDDPAGVNCQAVDLVLSIDGGENFDFIIAENVPNTGTYSFTVPPIPPTPNSRLMIQASENIFFDINNGVINIQNTNTPNVSLLEGNLEINLVPNSVGYFSFDIQNNGEVGSVLSYRTDVAMEYMINETFDGQILPQGWSDTTDAECDNPGWFISSDASSSYFQIPPADGFCIVVNDDACGGNSDGSNDMLFTNTFSLPEGLIELSFRRFFTGTYGQTLRVLISADNWENSDELLYLDGWDGNEEWVYETLNITSYAGQDIAIAFHSSDGGGWASGVALDNISIGFTPVWISTEANGYIGYGESESAEFMVNTEGMDLGVYSTSLVVENLQTSENDILGVTLNVTEEVIQVDQDILPLELHLYQNYPNPFNPETAIRFSVPVEQDVTLAIYDMLGKQIKVVNYENMNAGYHQFIWDGRNQSGHVISTGVYFCKLVTSSKVMMRKMLFLK